MSIAYLGPKISQVTSHFESKGQENTNCKGRAKLNRKLFRTIEKVIEMFCFLTKPCNLGLLFTCIFDFASFIIVDLFPCAHKNLGTHNLWGRRYLKSLSQKRLTSTNCHIWQFESCARISEMHSRKETSVHCCFVPSVK